MSIEEQTRYWIDSAEHDLTAAEHMLESGDYSWCLFAGHLVLEKMLKAFYVRDTRETPPKTHNLLFLAESTSLNLTQEQARFLFEVNGFNVGARHPNSRRQFHELFTREFALENLAEIRRFYQWLKSQIA